VELSLAGGCLGRDPSARCAVAVSRLVGDRVETLAQVDTGREIPEVVQVEGSDRRIRVRKADLHGPYFRELVSSYGPHRGARSPLAGSPPNGPGRTLLLDAAPCAIVFPE
jgi:IS5 family transposase